MKELFLFIFALGSLFLFLNWRVRKAQNSLEGNTTPDEIGAIPQHPDGTLYYFYHPKCGPCIQMLPIIDHLIQEYPDRVEKLNVADCPELVSTMGIKATPTTIFVKNNTLTRAIIGSRSGKALEALLQTN